MDSAPEASTHEARSSPASPLTPKRIIRRLAVPKLSPCLELNALLDTQQADSDVQELEASTSLLAPAGNHIASAFHEAKNEAPTSRIPVGGGLADVIRRQALTPSKRQNQSSPGGRPKGKTGRLGKGGGRESFAAVKKLAGSLAKRASLSETADVESSEDGVGLKSRDGQRRISAYFTPSPKKRSSQDEETESPAKAVKGRALFEAEGQVAAAQGGQVAALKEGQVAEGDSLAVEALENHVDSLKDGIDGAECGERGEGQPQGSATIVTGRVACEEGGTFLDGVDSENAGDEGQEAGTVPLVGPSNGAQEPPRIDQATENGLRLSTGLEHCSHVHGSGIGAQESMRGPCSVFTAEGCSSPGASEVGVSSAMDTEVPVDGSTGPTCIGTGEPDSPMQEETLEEPEWAKHQKAPLQITVLGESAVDPLGSAQKEGLFSGLLASKALATGSHSPEQKPADSSADSIRANPSPMDTGLLTEPEIDTRVSLSNPNLVPKPLQKLLSQMTAAPEPPTPNLEVTLEEAPGLGRPTELTVDAIDEMCAALLADIEDLPTTVPFLKGSPEPFTRRSPESLLDGSPKPSRTADGDPPKPSEISPSHIVPSSLSLNSMIEVTVTEETVERAALENTPNQAGTMSLLAPTSTPVEVLITERTVEQTVSAVPSTSEADLAEAQWRRKLGERRRRGRMSVTDLCALEWCEMQVDFSTRVRGVWGFGVRSGL